MRKRAFLGVRINTDLKGQLEAIASSEARSLSQICEIVLRAGVDAYQKEGPRFLQRFLSRQDKEKTPE